MNKLICVLTLVFTSFDCLAGSSSLCEGVELRIEPDMQIPESSFVKEEADKAKAELLKLDHETNDLLTKFAIENRNRIIQGYELKERALSLKTEEAVNEYCTFLVNEAFYHD
ncbi:hypothetical protein JYB88_16150 [Shewanella cyperi]|uniref:Uncharacterized protein n=1 Tax=Shewanella cyperi TaxID=2814292 RepID=A0A975AKT2_9GAMM|nr:hypothetical protein [Shewanella cyperi]QSX29702.1 hypothetical protein JYB88_16150 [Shewanella cyperi]